MATNEAPEATWDKRFKAKHYTYRDFYTAALAGPTTYTFGTNARGVSAWNWPSLNDFSQLPGNRLPCYAREIMVQATEDCWIVITSLNPVYLMLSALGYSQAQLAALNVPLTLNEVPSFIPAGAILTFYTTYGVAITHYLSLAQGGVIRVWIEGNVEGGE